MGSHLWGFRTLKSIYSSVLHPRGPDSGIQQMMATHSIPNPANFSSHTSNYHIWSYAPIILPQNLPFFLNFLCVPKCLSFCHVVLSAWLLFHHASQQNPLQLKVVFFMKTVQIYYTHTHIHTQACTHTHTPSQNQLPCLLNAHIWVPILLYSSIFASFPTSLILQPHIEL